MPISLPVGSKIYLSLQAVNMRKSFDGLAAQVRHLLSSDPVPGHSFLFTSRGGDREGAVVEWQWGLPVRQVAGRRCGCFLCLFVGRLNGLC